jgi:hypothetical protein
MISRGEEAIAFVLWMINFFMLLVMVGISAGLVGYPPKGLGAWAVLFLVALIGGFVLAGVEMDLLFRKRRKPRGDRKSGRG